MLSGVPDAVIDQQSHKEEFPITDWQMVHEASVANSADGRQALERLCENYYSVIHQCVASHPSAQNWHGEDVDDLTQDFIREIFLVQVVPRANSSRGSFRHFIRSSLKHFLSTRLANRRAQKRGGGILHEDIADHLELASPSGEVDLMQDRAWAWDAFRRAAIRLHERQKRAGTLADFPQLWALLWENTGEARRFFQQSHHVSQGATSQRLNRLRNSLRDCLRHEMDKLAGSDQVKGEEETLYLMRVLAKDLSSDETCAKWASLWTQPPSITKTEL